MYTKPLTIFCFTQLNFYAIVIFKVEFDLGENPVKSRSLNANYIVGITTFMRTYRISLHQVPRHSNLTINIPCPLMLDSADTTSSPVVTTRADTILEVVKAIGIPRHDLPPSHLRDESSCCMTIRTYPKVLEYTNWHSTRRMHQSISDS